MLKYGLPTIVFFSAILLATMPIKPAIGFCVLLWMMFAGCWGFRHVTNSTKRNTNSTYDIPSGGF